MTHMTLEHLLLFRFGPGRRVQRPPSGPETCKRLGIRRCLLFCFSLRHSRVDPAKHLNLSSSTTPRRRLTTILLVDAHVRRTHSLPGPPHSQASQCLQSLSSFFVLSFRCSCEAREPGWRIEIIFGTVAPNLRSSQQHIPFDVVDAHQLSLGIVFHCPSHRGSVSNLFIFIGEHEPCWRSHQPCPDARHIAYRLPAWHRSWHSTMES